MTRDFIYRHRRVFFILIFYQVIYFFGAGEIVFAAARPSQKTSAPTIAIIDVGGRINDESVRKNIVSSLISTFKNQTLLKPIDEKIIQSFVGERFKTNREERVLGLKRGSKLLRDGKDAYNRLNYNEAIERLTLAKKEFVANLNELKSNEGLLETFIYLGMAYIAQKKNEQAYSEFKKIVYLDSKLHISPKDYSPEVVSVFEKARQDVEQKPKGTLLLDSVPSNCSVYINAKSVNTTPLNMLLSVGDYFIKIEKEGYLDWYQLVTIEDKVNTIDVELSPISADEDLIMAIKPIIDSTTVDLETAGFLSDIGKRLSANLILLSWVERDVRDLITLQLYDLRTKKLSYPVSGSMGKNFSNIDNGIRKVVGEISSFIDEKGYVLAMQEVHTEKMPLIPETPKLTKEQIALQKRQNSSSKWWIWTLIGGIAAGAAVGVIYGTRGGGIAVDNRGNF